MTDKQGRLADLSLDERQRLEIEKQRELQDGLTNRHVADATERAAHLAVNFARTLGLGRR